MFVEDEDGRERNGTINQGEVVGLYPPEAVLHLREPQHARGKEQRHHEERRFGQRGEYRRIVDQREGEVTHIAGEVESGTDGEVAPGRALALGPPPGRDGGGNGRRQRPNKGQRYLNRQHVLQLELQPAGHQRIRTQHGGKQQRDRNTLTRLHRKTL